MAEGNNVPPWYTRPGIRARWDHERDTGPQKVVLAKLCWEGAIPGLASMVAGGGFSALIMELEMVSPQTISMALAVFGGVFLFFYLKAGFKDSVIRGR